MSTESRMVRPLQRNDTGFGDAEIHELTDEAELNSRIAELHAKVDALDLIIDEYEVLLQDDDSEPEARAYTLSEIETAFEAVIELLEAIPEQLLLTRRECSQMAQRCFYRIHEMEPHFLHVVNAQFREQIQNHREQGSKIFYRSVFELLSDDQQVVVQKLLNRESPKLTDRQEVLEKMTQYQLTEQRHAEKLPPHLVRYCADVYAEMQMVELDYNTEARQLDEVWLDTTGMEELPQRLTILVEIVRADLMRAGRLFAIAGDAASETIAKLRDRNQQLAQEYTDLHLPALAFTYEQIHQHFDAMIQLIGVYDAFHSARPIIEA